MPADGTTPLRERPAWRALERHHADLAPRHLRDLFAEDPARGERMALEAAGLYLDVGLRMPRERSLIVEGADVVAEVHEVLDRMAAFCLDRRPGAASAGWPGTSPPSTA